TLESPRRPVRPLPRDRLPEPARQAQAPVAAVHRGGTGRDGRLGRPDLRGDVPAGFPRRGRRGRAPAMTNQEKRERRREAALNGARPRAAKQEPAEPAPPEEPAAPTGRQLLERAQSIGREADLWYHAHLGRWPHRPSAWTAAQRIALSAFLDRFLWPDGTPQPVLHRGRRTRP